ncbi:MAG: hypothetical protein FJ128_03550 [Deltaproteobacteria bacterium]|nr:hypothetical protein [Deltaproteobacteria bacterium]
MKCNAGLLLALFTPDYAAQKGGNQAWLKMGVLAYNLLPMIRQFYVWGEEEKRCMDWLIKRLNKVGARISYHARRWYVHVASASPLAHHYRAVLAWGL